jgi:hypothetical protein
MTAPQPKFREPTVSRETKLYRALSKGPAAQAVLAGRVLVIDPSSGSTSSLPGYAVYAAGHLTDSGLIEMPVGTELVIRLRYLNRCLREEFTEKFDALIVEAIPPFRFSGGRASAAGQLSLHKAVAVVESAFDVPHVLYVSPQTWRAFAPVDYVKGDEADAVTMGHAVLSIARAALEHRASPRKSTKKKR